MSTLEKKERRRLEREAMQDKDAQKSFWIKIVGVGAVSGILVGALVLWNSGVFGGDEAHAYDGFASCLTDAGFTMYGTDWCPHCQDQKKMFGGSFELIDYVNCDFNKTLCNNKGVEGYPTWYLGAKMFDSGVQTFRELGEAAACEVPEIVD